MAAEKKLDLFWLLGQIDRKNYNLWDQLDADQRKEVSPYVLTMWMAGTNDPEQLVNLGMNVATRIFDFGGKTELLLKMLTAASTGPKRYEWCAPKNTKKRKLTVELIAKAYRMPLQHAEEVLPMFSNAELEELAKEQGFQADEMKDLKKELAK